MRWPLALVVFLSVFALVSAPALAQNITNVVERNGDNEATDTITAKWTGQTFNVTVAGEPVPGMTVGTPFTVPTFGNQAPTYVDRNHRYLNHLGSGGTVPPPVDFVIPAYLVGGEYIMSGNDNRDNNPPTLPAYQLDVTISQPSTVYMLIDNRLGGGAADPPTFGPTAMQWILDQGWIATSNGLNRTANPAVPDEVPIDEGGNNDVQNWFSVYRKEFQPGTFSLFQADNTGQNMYGVVVVAIPEPSTIALLGFAVAGLAIVVRRRRRS